MTASEIILCVIIGMFIYNILIKSISKAFLNTAFGEKEKKKVTKEMIDNLIRFIDKDFPE